MKLMNSWFPFFGSVNRHKTKRPRTKRPKTKRRNAKRSTRKMRGG